MAQPVGFEGANKVFLAPDEMEDCQDLECFMNDNLIVSCWRFSDEELKKIQETGVVWLGVMSRQISPTMVSGDALVFIGDRPSKAEPILPKRLRK